MWACALINNEKIAVPVERIKKFDPENFDPKKQFYIETESGDMAKALILFIKSKNISI